MSDKHNRLITINFIYSEYFELVEIIIVKCLRLKYTYNFNSRKILILHFKFYKTILLEFMLVLLGPSYFRQEGYIFKLHIIKHKIQAFILSF